jgi:hypothetical protein
MAKAKVLVYDIETSPIVSYNWGIYEQNAIEVIEDWQILCFAYKWLGDKKTYVVAQNDFQGYKKGVNDDYQVVKRLHELFDEADVVIAHNGNKFDQKKAHARFLANGLTPPSPYKQIDTLQVARRYAAFTSNKLDDLGVKLGVGKKAPTGGFATWKGCLSGDSKAWNTMKKYNRQDVVLLEKIYLKLRPWITNHPAMNVLEGYLDACPKCAGGPLQKRGTLKLNNGSTVQRYQCMANGCWSQSKTVDKVPVRYVNTT